MIAALKLDGMKRLWIERGAWRDACEAGNGEEHGLRTLALTRPHLVARNVVRTPRRLHHCALDRRSARRDGAALDLPGGWGQHFDRRLTWRHCSNGTRNTFLPVCREASSSRTALDAGYVPPARPALGHQDIESKARRKAVAAPTRSLWLLRVSVPLWRIHFEGRSIPILALPSRQ